MNERPQCGHTTSSPSSAAATRRKATWQWGQMSRIISRTRFGGPGWVAVPVNTRAVAQGTVDGSSVGLPGCEEVWAPVRPHLMICVTVHCGSEFASGHSICDSIIIAHTCQIRTANAYPAGEARRDRDEGISGGLILRRAEGASALSVPVTRIVRVAHRPAGTITQEAWTRWSRRRPT